MTCGTAVAAPGPAEGLAQLACIDFSDEIDRLTRDFTGRAQLFAEVAEWLDHGTDRLFLLTAQPGVGKSAFAARLTQVMADRLLAAHFCIAGRNNTVVPGSALRSLAALLAATRPDYGQALAHTVKPTQLRINVNIDVAHLDGGHVTGVVIRNLKPTDPETELDILLRAPLAHMAAPEQPAFLLIDSLDEALTHRGRVNLVSLLAEIDDFPDWVRFFCTTRPERGVLRYFEGRTTREIAAESAANREDLQHFIDQRLEEPAIVSRCHASGVETEQLAERILGLARGNFLFTRVLCDDIAAGRQVLTDLSTLPGDLDQIYHAFLLRFNAAEWRERYQPILAVLAVAFEALDAEQLGRFTAASRTQLRQALGVLTQFLRTIRHRDAPERYELFHQSFRDFLGAEARNPDFWCAPEDGHAAISGYYLKSADGRWREAQNDGYLFEHLAAHLDAQAGGANPEDPKDPDAEAALIALCGNPDWRQARVAHAGYLHQGYLADVDLAWSRAEARARSQIDQRQTLTALADCVRFALIHTEVNSLASDYLPALVALALEFGLPSWSPERAMEAAASVPDAEPRLKLLVALIETETLSPEQLRQAMELRIETILETHSTRIDERRDTRLKALAPLVPDECLEPLLQAALSLEHPTDRRNVVIKLLDRLPEALYSLAVNAVWPDPDETVRAGLLIRQARLTPAGAERREKERQALALIFEAARQDSDEGLQEFTAFVKDLDPALLEEAYEEISRLKGRRRNEWLSLLIPYLPLPIRDAAAADFAQSAERAQQIELQLDIMRRHPSPEPQVLDRLLALIAATEPEEKRAGLLSRVWWSIPAALDARLCTAIEAMVDAPKARADALLASIKARDGQLEAGLVPRLLNAAKRIDTDGYLQEALVTLAPVLEGELLEEALNVALGIATGSDRGQALTGLAPQLSGSQVQCALDGARAIDPETFTWLNGEAQRQREACAYQVNVLEAIAPKLSTDQLDAALDWVKGMADDTVRTRGQLVLLGGATCAVPDTLVEATLAAFIDRDYAEAMLALAPRLEGPALRRALEAVLERWPAGFANAEAAAALRRLPRQDAMRIIAAGLSQPEGSGSRRRSPTTMIRAFGQWLAPPHLERLYNAARALPGEANRASALGALLPHLDDKRRNAAAAEMLDSASDSVVAQMLPDFMPYLEPDRIANTLTRVLAMTNPRDRVAALGVLLPKVERAQVERGFEDLLETLTQMTNVGSARLSFETDYRKEAIARSLIAAAGRLPELPSAHIGRALQALRHLPEKTLGEVLDAWAPGLPDGHIRQALQLAAGIEEGGPRHHAVAALGDRLAKNPALLSANLANADEFVRGALLVGAARSDAPLDPEFLLNAAAELENAGSRAGVLEAVGPRLPDALVEEAFAMAQELGPGFAPRTVCALVPRLGTKLLPAATPIALNHYDDARVRALAERLEDPVWATDAREDVADTLWWYGMNARQTALVLGASPYVSDGLQEQLTAMASYALEQRREGRRLGRDLSPFAIAAVARQLSKQLPDDDQEALLTTALEEALDDRLEAVRNIVELIPLLPPSSATAALDRMAALDSDEVVDALLHVADVSTDDVSTRALALAFEATSRAEDEEEYVRRAGLLAPVCQKDQIAPLLQRVLATNPDRYPGNAALEAFVERLRAEAQPLPDVAEVVLCALRATSVGTREPLLKLLVSGLLEPGVVAVDAATVAAIVSVVLELD